MKRLLLLIPFALLLAGCGGTSGGTGNPNQGHLGETAGVAWGLRWAAHAPPPSLPSSLP